MPEHPSKPSPDALFSAGTPIRALERLTRSLLLALTRRLYRLRVRGAEHLPREGGALLVSNHLSYVDPFLVAAAVPRPVRFLMYRAFFARPLVGRFARFMGTIAIAAEDGPRAQVRSLRLAAEHAARGELVCIFAEGQISRRGSLLPFARGLEKIARAARVPIVPIALDGVWGSVFSFAGGRALRKWPQRFPGPVRVEIGAPLPPDSPAWLVRDRVQGLVSQARRELAGARDTLPSRFLRSATRHARRTAVVDSTGARLTYRRLLQASLALAAVLRRRLPGEARIGIYLPPGAGGVVANLAASLAGRVPVNLNYSLGPAELADPISRAGVRALVTSPRFVEALGTGLPAGVETVLEIEELARELRPRERLAAFALSYLPGFLLARILRPVRDPQATATILFSSGSTGRPKGVVLTHANVLSNLLAVAEAFDLGVRDRMLGVLPFFHSFGFTATLWAPLLRGATAVYHATPTDARTIARLCAEERVTILLATPTFYQGWMRRVSPQDLASVRLAVVGAEKLRPSLADAWRERFGFELFEGYGCTELSPVVSVNLPDRGLGADVEIGSRAGSVGRPLPGVAVRVVDPRTRALLPPGTEGLVLVSGPSVMAGYLDEPERTTEVLCDGWYDTGDLGRIDREGFLFLTDRVARFSKVGGEMVPHGRIEEALSDIARRLARELGAPESEPALAVTAVPDEKKGERLVVLHAPLGFSAERLVEGLRASELPALFQPRADEYFEVPDIPRLGSGKTDLAALRRIAAAKSGVDDPRATREDEAR